MRTGRILLLLRWLLLLCSAAWLRQGENDRRVDRGSEVAPGERAGRRGSPLAAAQGGRGADGAGADRGPQGQGERRSPERRHRAWLLRRAGQGRHPCAEARSATATPGFARRPASPCRGLIRNSFRRAARARRTNVDKGLRGRKAGPLREGRPEAGVGDCPHCFRSISARWTRAQHSWGSTVPAYPCPPGCIRSLTH